MLIQRQFCTKLASFQLISIIWWWIQSYSFCSKNVTSNSEIIVICHLNTKWMSFKWIFGVSWMYLKWFLNKHWNMRYKMNASKGFWNEWPANETNETKVISFKQKTLTMSKKKQLECTHIYAENLTGQPKELEVSKKKMNCIKQKKKCMTEKKTKYKFGDLLLRVFFHHWHWWWKLIKRKRSIQHIYKKNVSNSHSMHVEHFASAYCVTGWIECFTASVQPNEREKVW